MKPTPLTTMAPGLFQYSFAFLVTGLGLLSAPAHSDKILFYFGLSGHSHVSSIWPAIEVLGDRGHEITILTSIPPKTTHPAVSVVFVPEMFEVFKDIWDEGGDLLTARFSGNQLSSKEFIPIGLATCSALLSAPSAQALIHNSTFDLVIIDTGMNECGLALAALKYKCPHMIYIACPAVPSNDDYGMPLEHSWIPNLDAIGGVPPKTFFDRVYTTFRAIQLLWERRVDYFSALSQIFVEKFNLKPEEAPDFVDLTARTSVALLNGYFTHVYTASLPPLVVPIAGVGIQEKRTPVPRELAAFVDSAEDGFVYVSFGTAVTISKSRPELRRKFFNVFGSLAPIRFVWKWEGDERPADAPANIHFGSWMPQQDLLAHPKVRGYVSHGGANGMNEGVYFGVPMVIFPVLADQDYNAHALAAKGLGHVMEITNFTEEELQEKLVVILNDDVLKARVKRASAVFKDRPMKPVDTAVWWIEHVLRYKNTSYLMPDAVHQSWYQRRLLDVWFFAYTVLVASLTAVLWLCWKLYVLIRKLLLTSKSKSGVESRKIKKN